MRWQMVPVCLGLLAVTGCDLLQRLADTRHPRLAPEAAGRVSLGGLTVLDRITVPAIARVGPLIKVTTPGGVHFAIDMRELLDPDDGFRPIGEATDLDAVAPVIIETLKGLFEMGYYDRVRGRFNQAAVDDLLSKLRFTKPVWAKNAEGNLYLGSADVLALHEGGIAGVAGLARHQDGSVSLGTTEYAGTLDGLPKVWDVYPALGRDAAQRALRLASPGYAVQGCSAPDLERVAVHTNLHSWPGTVKFFWRCKRSTDPYLVRVTGDVYRYEVGRGVQTLRDFDNNHDVQLQETKAIVADPAEFAGLRR